MDLHTRAFGLFSRPRNSHLYIAVKDLSGTIKATVHCPRPPDHPDYERHFGFVYEASGAVADAVRKDAGRHIIRWTGYPLGSTYTLEYKVRVRGISLSAMGTRVSPKVKLLPMPTEYECVDIGVLLGEPATANPKEIDGVTTHLLDEGSLCGGRRVWIIYCVQRIREPGEQFSSSKLITPEKSYCDPNADLSTGTLRAIVYGAQPDGSLGFRIAKLPTLHLCHAEFLHGLQEL